MLHSVYVVVDSNECSKNSDEPCPKPATESTRNSQRSFSKYSENNQDGRDHRTNSSTNRTQDVRTVSHGVRNARHATESSRNSQTGFVKCSENISHGGNGRRTNSHTNRTPDVGGFSHSIRNIRPATESTRNSQKSFIKYSGNVNRGKHDHRSNSHTNRTPHVGGFSHSIRNIRPATESTRNSQKSFIKYSGNVNRGKHDHRSNSHTNRTPHVGGFSHSVRNTRPAIENTRNSQKSFIKYSGNVNRGKHDHRSNSHTNRTPHVGGFSHSIRNIRPATESTRNSQKSFIKYSGNVNRGKHDHRSNSHTNRTPHVGGFSHSVRNTRPAIENTRNSQKSFIKYSGNVNRGKHDHRSNSHTNRTPHVGGFSHSIRNIRPATESTRNSQKSFIKYSENINHGSHDHRSNSRTNRIQDVGGFSHGVRNTRPATESSKNSQKSFDKCSENISRGGSSGCRSNSHTYIAPNFRGFSLGVWNSIPMTLGQNRSHAVSTDVNEKQRRQFPSYSSSSKRNTSNISSKATRLGNDRKKAGLQKLRILKPVSKNMNEQSVMAQKAENHILKKRSETNSNNRKIGGKWKCTSNFSESQELAAKDDEQVPSKKPCRVLGYKLLQELKNCESNEILLTLRLPDYDLISLLKNDFAKKRELLALILICLGKACKSTLCQSVMVLVNIVTNIREFMFGTVQLYLASFENSKNDEIHYQSFEKLLEFLSCYNLLLPASASETLTVILPLLRVTCTSFQQKLPVLFNTSLEKIDELDAKKSSFLKKHTKEEIDKVTETEKLHNVQPPENFRDISILPDTADIWDHEPFLRPNITKGKYSNVEHYLDVQFRLLREDYVRPLREGITAYLKCKKAGELIKNNKGVKIYTDVHIISQEFDKGNLLFIGRFNINDFERINWERSKRFLSGSLVCLSDDEFQTCYFASIAYRDVEKLRNGFLILKFEKLSNEVLGINSAQTFVMIETDAYFEAYRHNLSALQDVQHEFPLHKYIINAQTEIGNPCYLVNETAYDISPLLKPLDHSTGVLRSRLERTVKLVNVLDDETWPTKEELSLDKSQYEALKAATTKEFAVIQGPPGTGKTYIGLRIVQLLLHNISCWKPYEQPCPILIVCYTNHALDQFLEGVLQFTKDIIRVGGGSTSAQMAVYQLDKLRKAKQNKQEVPHYIFSNIMRKNKELSCLGKKINELQNEIKKYEKRELTEVDLANHISAEHLKSLKSLVKGNLRLDDSHIMLDWLEIRFRKRIVSGRPCNLPIMNPSITMSEYPFLPPMYGRCHSVEGNNLLPKQSLLLHVNRNNDLFSQRIGQRVDVHNIISMANNSVCNMPVMEEGNNQEEEADIQYIEDMRGIDAEDFADIVIKPVQENDTDSVNNDDILDGEDEWQTQDGQKSRKECVNKMSMTEKEVGQITDVWSLQMDDRWRLYRYWLNLLIEEKQNELLQLLGKIRNVYEEINEMKTEENLYLLRQAKVIGMTTTGAAKYRRMVRDLNPRIIIVEEAAEILECHVVTSLAMDTQHLVLIGDHQQLRPNPHEYELAKYYNLGVSLFERMVNNGMDFKQLIIQHRMRPCISALLVPHIYENLQNHESVFNYENIKGVQKNMFFVNHDFFENRELDSKSRVNTHEVTFLTKLCRYFILQGYSSSQITVLTTYSGQFFAIKRKFAEPAFAGLLKGVRVSVVDNFQGEENDIILISFVRSNEDGVIGFLKVANRVCVALSRAKNGLFAIGNFSLLAEKSYLWKNIVDSLNQQKAIGPTLSLKCQNHPENVTQVSTADHFDQNVPEGGCMRPCEYRLPCEHICTRICHTYDRAHERFKCEERCTKVLCEYNHPCTRKCYMDCGSCVFPVEKQIPECKHAVMVPCSVDAGNFSCSHPCEKELPCNHPCKKRCGVKCTSRCTEFVTVKLICGHDMELKCYDIANKDSFSHLCSVKCESELQCGHICSGTCGKCYQGRLHQACKEQCKRILVCGHECTALCCKNCPCRHHCENRCNHSRCPYNCEDPCRVCTEPCIWQCKHKKCKKLCGELCDRKPCYKPCSRKLRCGHTCIGLCGEPCPKSCIKCNPEIKEVFLGSENKEGAKFIELEECNHVFEVTDLTQWMRIENQKGEIQMKTCPRCKTVIRKNLHFGNIIKTNLADIEKVKRMIFGEVEANEEKLYTLLIRIGELRPFPEFYRLLPLKRFLVEKQKISNLEIIRSEHIITLMEKYFSIKKNLKRDIAILSYPQLVKFVQKTYQLIEVFISRKYSTATEQQIEELSWEIQRLNLTSKLTDFLVQYPYNLTNLIKPCSEIFADICTNKPFCSSEENLFNSKFNEVLNVQGSQSIISVSETE